MTTFDPTSLTIATAQKLLRQFLCIERIPASVLANKATIRSALLLVAEASDYQIFGICADNATQAITALQNYLQALDYPFPSERPEMAGSIYIKFNPHTRKFLAEPYTGQHRGVLISCQSADPNGINETFGHLPLDLFTA
jgi:hypothetical protein